MKNKADFITNSSSASYIIFDTRDVPDRKVMQIETVIDFMDNVEITFEDVETFKQRYYKVDPPDPHYHWRQYDDKEGKLRYLSEKEYLAVINALSEGQTVHFYCESLEDPISHFFQGEKIIYDFYNGP